MSSIITMSFSAPVELSIKMEEYMETKGWNRSKLIKTAIAEYINSQEKKGKHIDFIEETHANVIKLQESINSIVIKKE
jgi:metal-responsive CopG/Arc/MetJ family transcriptional regulator